MTNDECRYEKTGSRMMKIINSFRKNLRKQKRRDRKGFEKVPEFCSSLASCVI